MKKIFLIALAMMAFSLHAQENTEQPTTPKTFKVSRSKGKLQINLGKVTVEGYKGNEILFTLENKTRPEDKRADGLQSINALGLTDNTGLGINVTEKEGVLEVNPLKKMSQSSIKIMVPENMSVSFKHQSQFGSNVEFKNLSGEIEIAATYNSVKLENITGPAVVKSVYGNVEAVFSQPVKGPVSIISVYGYADVSLPKSVKANLQAKTSYGEIYISPEFKVEVEKKTEDGLIRFGDEFLGKINGGGTDISVSSDYSKIYLRAK